MEHLFDVAVIGGGINGCGIAADASMRGLSVLLVEKDDLASKTSSSSTKLIHGGLRYLEYFNFRYVKKSLNERQTLLQVAPHIIHPLPLVLPYERSLRPAWVIRAGLFLYDNLSRKNRLPKSKAIHRTRNAPYFLPLVTEIDKGFVFYDCATDDARLTLENALQAKMHGATILTNSELISASVHDGLWHLNIQAADDHTHLFKARSIINATGPWALSVNQRLTISDQYNLSLVKGSHLVVTKLYEGDHAYLLQNVDKRIVFVIPWHGYSMIGTTDQVFSENLDSVSISSNEVTYLFKLISQYFNYPLTQNDIITTWSGVRPLLSVKGKSPQALERDYAYHFTSTPAPEITIYGGKITTYRQLAEDVVDELKAIFPTLEKSTTDTKPLPGAILGDMRFADYQHFAEKKYHWLNKHLLIRLLNTYGTNTEKILNNCANITDLGKHFGCELYQREVDYLLQHEWVTTVEDILWRRTKLGLKFSLSSKEQLHEYLLIHGSTQKNKTNALDEGHFQYSNVINT